jgi:malto-oligosyltrehalose synthase/4-alpha-glucanotransferase
MANPTATYRIQFHKDFTFKDLDQQVPYLKELGVQTLYASPIFAAVPGSTHGYDSINPHQINPEIGTEEELIKVARKLQQNGIEWLQDIVPNHMAYHSANAWLMDVLANWDQSPYFDFFDINFPSKLSDPRLMVPFLGEDLASAIANHSIQLQSKEENLFLVNGDNFWPINSSSYAIVSKSYTSLAVFQDLVKNQSELKKLTIRLEEINQDAKILQEIADAQYYRLCHWQETEKALNYRRFFTVNGLICLNIQHQHVFDTYHQYILKLLKDNVFQGLRIDHIDGLSDPTTYLQRLRDAVGPDVYIVVEKILGADEKMPQHWPMEGNTGYDFLAMVNNLFTNREAEKSFNKLYREVIQKPLKVAEQIIVKKEAILYEHMQGELDHLVQLFHTLQLADQKQLKALPKDSLKTAIGDFLIYCPVYRFYGNQFPLTGSEKNAVQHIFDQIPKTEAQIPAFNLLASILLGKPKDDNDSQQEKILQFYQRCMQFSGPLMAKGVEDTLMYTYNRFIGHTEVGDAPDAFGLSIPKFHQKMIDRRANWPLSMNGTSTHDTKRGEDVRARLNVLTDIPERWRKLVFKLQKSSYKGTGSAFDLHKNDAYLIFQTLLGAFPFLENEEDGLEERMAQYVEKALREAKKRSGWATPNESYEIAAKQFAVHLLAKDEKNYQLLSTFFKEIADYSIINSLAQVLLKFTCPGIPDLYQGTELWDLSLVDPDNRRPVDYELRRKMLEELKDENSISKLWEERYSGKIKLWLTQLLLQTRGAHKALFDQGAYIPLKIKGSYHKNVLAFLRKHNQQYVLIAIPLGLAKLAPKELEDCRQFDWEDTEILLPPDVPNEWQNIFTNEDGQKDVLNEGIKVSELFAELPIALLKFKPLDHGRGSGILLHISSLPSGFGVGDLGPEAFKFVDLLATTKQKYWQLLPLNPTDALQCHSPYSAYSAMAGNVLLISPDFLAEQQLLQAKDLKHYRVTDKDKVEYKKAFELKADLLQLAYQNFSTGNHAEMNQQFIDFCGREEKWLSDFALFTAIRKHHQLMPWIEWPEAYKLRDPETLLVFSTSFAAEITEIKWQQFIFYLQWHNLKAYANANGVKLIGDLPFYVGFDSADVWANTGYFKLDEHLQMTALAGVPPDFFNTEGQLWGMPIFDWKALEQDGYRWWMERLSKNVELFDLLRLDHFRAFHTYWEIPYGDENAINGKWINGPGAPFLEAVCKNFDQLPFVVEDLGGDMEAPIALRNQFNLPGMKVLQFGFGADMALSTHLPHNYENSNFIVYPGTHDNNTIKGWYTKELDEKGKQRLNLYAGKKVNEENVNEVLIQMGMASIAKISIFQMQDILGLDENSRMNTPASQINNWLWRLQKDEITDGMKSWLLQQTELYGRG